MAQLVKDPTLLLQQLELLLWCQFSPELGSSTCSRYAPPPKKKKELEKDSNLILEV